MINYWITRLKRIQFILLQAIDLNILIITFIGNRLQMIGDVNKKALSIKCFDFKKGLISRLYATAFIEQYSSVMVYTVLDYKHSYHVNTQGCTNMLIEWPQTWSFNQYNPTLP